MFLWLGPNEFVAHIMLEMLLCSHYGMMKAPVTLSAMLKNVHLTPPLELLPSQHLCMGQCIHTQSFK